MQLVLGLGNPGPSYRGNRHNIGFRCLERLAADLGLRFEGETPAYREAAGDGPAGALSLVQPLTFMNRSGEALRAWSRDRGLPVGGAPPPGELAVVPEQEPDPVPSRPASPSLVVPVVVCDDIHLPLGSIRIRARGSDGGQNGLASIIAVCGEGVPRVRLGVGPRQGTLAPEDWADYVLQDFAADERDAVEELLDTAALAVKDLLVLGPQQAGARHNRRTRPDPDLPADG
jgi:PTH1 family peptidyl-tRNA hydrolase